ncbi:DUF6268 family outer membrane beta-barrel protein [Myroides sp. LJL119]
MIKKSMFLIGSLLLSINCFSQEQKVSERSKDSISAPRQVASYAADKFTIIRPLNIEFTSPSPYKYKTDKGMDILDRGKVNRFQQIKVTATATFVKKRNYGLGVTLGYKNTDLDLKPNQPNLNKSNLLSNNYHYFFTSFNFAYFSSLFGKRVVYSASAVVEGSDKHFENIKGIISGVIVLKSSPKSVLSVGLLGNIDVNTQVPVLPIVTYEVKFNKGFVFDATLPKSIYLRKNTFSAGRISLGSEMDLSSFYLYNFDNTNKTYLYRQVEINSGLVYEYALGDFVLTAKGGLKVTPSARIFEKHESFNDAVVELKPDPTFYFNVGISFNPFTLLKKRELD